MSSKVQQNVSEVKAIKHSLRMGESATNAQRSLCMLDHIHKVHKAIVSGTQCPDAQNFDALIESCKKGTLAGSLADVGDSEYGADDASSGSGDDEDEAFRSSAECSDGARMTMSMTTELRFTRSSAISVLQ